MELQQYVKQFAFHYLEHHPEDFSVNLHSKKFEHSFVINQSIWENYLEFVQSQGVQPKFNYPASVQTEIKRYIKARMAKQLFGEGAYYSVLAMDDPMVEEALQILSRSNPLSVIQK